MRIRLRGQWGWDTGSSAGGELTVRSNPFIPQAPHDQDVILNTIQKARASLSTLQHKSRSFVKSHRDLVGSVHFQFHALERANKDLAEHFVNEAASQTSVAKCRQ